MLYIKTWGEDLCYCGLEVLREEECAWLQKANEPEWFFHYQAALIPKAV